MTREEKQKAIDALKISVPITALTHEEFNDYIQTINKVMDWLEQEPILDKIRAKIHATAEMHEDGDYYLRDEWIDEILDKYKAESEENNG